MIMTKGFYSYGFQIVNVDSALARAITLNVYSSDPGILKSVGLMRETVIGF